MRNALQFFINGQKHRVNDYRALQPLSTYLREEKSMVGTKIVCEEGDCGACTVLLGRPHDSGFQYEILDSCIHFVFQLDNCHVITIEGLNPGGKLHQVQDAMIQYFGSQCGFCTPGFVMAIADLVEKEELIDETKIKNKLTGNLCRCTGYEPIIKACLALNDESSQKITESYNNQAMLAELRPGMAEDVQITCHHHGSEKTIFLPSDLPAALACLAANPDVKIVAGATDIGVQVNKGRIAPEKFMAIHHLDDLTAIKVDGDQVTIGAATPWSQVAELLREKAPQLCGILDIFASEQIKNVGTMGGNIANASPIADSLPFLLVSEAMLTLQSETGERQVNINQFYKGYKQLDLKEGEMITRITFALPCPDEVLRLYKVSKRRDLDISTFTAAIRCRLNGDTIEKASVAYGGVGPVVLRLPDTEKYLTGQKADEETFITAGKKARDEITPISDVRATADYRYQLAENILRKYYWQLQESQGVPA